MCYAGASKRVFLGIMTKSEARNYARLVWRDFLCNEAAVNKLLFNLNSFLRQCLVINSRILISLPLKQELNYLSILEDFENSLYAPRTLSKTKMEFRKITLKQYMKKDLTEDFIGLQAPSQDDKIFPLLELPLTSKDIVIVPSLSLSQDGGRLGRGGGYYDYYYSENLSKSRVKLLALIPEGLENQDFETESHDLKINIVITAKGLKYL